MGNLCCKQIDDTIDNVDGDGNSNPREIFWELMNMVRWKEKGDVSWDKFTKVFHQALEANIAQKVLELKDDYGRNLFLLLFTVKGGPRIDIVTMILEVNPKVIYVKSENVDTCLHDCIYYNAPLDIVKYIIDIYPEATTETNSWKRAPVHCIQKKTSLDVVKYIVQKNPKTTIMRDNSDRTPLEEARMKNASEDVIQYLLKYKHGYYFDGQTYTPLEGAILIAFLNSKDKISYVYKNDNYRRKPKKNNDINWEDLRNYIISLGSEMIGKVMTCCYDTEGKSILQYMLRIKGGRPPIEIFEILLKEYPDIFSTKDHDGKIALHHVIESNSVTVDVSKLIVDNTDQNFIIEKDNNENTPLHYITQDTSIKIIKWIVEKNSEATAMKDADGKVILHHAIERYFTADVVKFIFENTDLKTLIQSDSRNTALLRYIVQNNFYNSETTALKDEHGQVALHYAVERDFAEDVVKLIVDNTDKSLLIEKDNKDKSPLHYIHESTSLEIIRLIIEKNSEAATVKDADGKVMLHHAIERNSAIDVVKFIIDNTEHHLIIEKDKKGKTPLHYITQNISLEIVQKIVNVFPKIVFMKDTDGKFAHEIAIEKNSSYDVRRFLCKTYLKEAPKPRFPNYPKPTHGGNGSVKPIFWGMTLAQFNSFIHACQENHGLWEALQYRNLGKLKEEPFISGYDINEYFVKEFTAKFGSCVALRINWDNPRRAQIMVSHPWGEDIKETQRSLNDSIEDKSTVIWFCIFANYQNEDGCGPSLTEQIKMEPFKQVISIPDLKGMVVIHSSRVELYDRKWCVHEIDEALDKKLNIIVGCSAEYLDAMFWGNLDFQVDTASAKCSIKSDEDYIDSLVMKKKGGYDRLNRVIREFRKKFLEREEITVTIPAEESAGFSIANTKPPMISGAWKSLLKGEGVTVGTYVTKLTLEDGTEYTNMTSREFFKHMRGKNFKLSRKITFHKPKTKVKRNNLSRYIYI